MITILLFLPVLFLLAPSELSAELWEQDVTSEMKIGLSETGYRRVDLRCGADSFLVNVTLEKEFEGVVYTRGSFENKRSSCFKHHGQGIFVDDAFLMRLEIPFHKCQTVMDVADSRYTNTLVIQHDPDFVMPGDAAFSLDCAFTPEFKMTTKMTAEPEFKSMISLVDADPASHEKPKDKKYQVQSSSDQVSFLPSTRGAKDEL